MRRRFIVDKQICIGCRLCHERAPQNFEVLAGEITARAIRQPANEAEEEACVEALEYCPSGGIQILRREVAPPEPYAEPLLPLSSDLDHASGRVQSVNQTTEVRQCRLNRS